MPTTDPVFLGGTDGLNKMHWHEWVEDFDFYLATNYVITEAGSGTRAIAQAKDGILVITNAAADDDHNYIQVRDVASGQVAEHWKFTAGKRLFFEARFKVSDATQSDWVMGLQITDTSPLATSDGIWFQKDDGDKHIDFHVAKGSTQTDVTAMADCADDTYMKLSFYYDGQSSFINCYKDGVLIGNAAITNAPTTEEIVVSFAIQNGEAVAKLMSLDYIRVVQERG